MNMQRLPSDVIGLSKVMPPLSRRGFMSSSAAAAAGYTLAAGSVRAEAIQTDTKGLDAGMTKVKVSDGEMPAYYARPGGVAHPGRAEPQTRRVSRGAYRRLCRNRHVKIA